MTIKKWYIVLVMLGLQACESFDRPEGVLDEQKFEDVLVDVHIADAVLLNKGMNDFDLNNINLSHYNQVFIKNKVEPESFARSVEYYSQHMKQYKRIYENVLQRITDKYDVLQRADSARNIGPKGRRMQPVSPEME